jgi:hypothetical protein
MNNGYRKFFLPLIALCALATLLSRPALAQDEDAGDEKEAAAAASKSTGGDKGHFEGYLKGRLAKIQSAHKQRMDFFAQEKKHWDDFWTKIRDERKKFELSMTRQTLDLFESLNSLAPKDQPTTVANFEKMQGDLLKSFEADQKARMQEFFVGHEKHWTDFAALQEKERAQFMADAESGWQHNKEMLQDRRSMAQGKTPKKHSAKKASAPADGGEKKSEGDQAWH